LIDQQINERLGMMVDVVVVVVTNEEIFLFRFCSFFFLI